LICSQGGDVTMKISKLSLAGIVLMVALASVGVASACEGWGCTPGFWKNHPEAWPDSAIPPEQLTGLGDVDGDGDPDTYIDMLGYKGGPGVDGARKILLRAATAAYLNQYAFGEDFTCSDDWFDLYVEAFLSGDRATMIANANLIDDCNNSICEKENIGDFPWIYRPGPR